MMTVHEVSKISGVSIRALHHYDKIGLLPATEVTNVGYRFHLLKLRKEHLQNLIDLACGIKAIGVKKMSFEAKFFTRLKEKKVLCY